MTPIRKAGLGVILLVSSPLHFLFAQNAEVVGKVVDGVSGLAIPFAQVQIDNSNISVTADSAGNFSMKKLPEKEVVMFFSHSGYEPYVGEFSLNAKRMLDIQARLRPWSNFSEGRTEPDTVAIGNIDPYRNSSMINSNLVIEGAKLKSFEQASFNVVDLMRRLVILVPGARFYNGEFYFQSGAARRAQAALVLVNNTYIGTSDYNGLPLRPMDVVRVEVCNPSGDGIGIAGTRGYGGAINFITRK